MNVPRYTVYNSHRDRRQVPCEFHEAETLGLRIRCFLLWYKSRSVSKWVLACIVFKHIVHSLNSTFHLISEGALATSVEERGHWQHQLKMANQMMYCCALMVIGLASMAVFCQGQYSSDQVQNYRILPTSPVTGQQRAQCYGKYSRCYGLILQCPAECPVRKPKKARKVKGCMIDCRKCETSCKIRKPNCKGYGSICYDPRFVGGDGVMFYFHGMKDRDFALVSDDRIQINAHFIGTRPEGRKRDYTWVQALGIVFGDIAHTFTVGANKVSKWDDSVDQFTFSFDGADLKVADVWTSPCGQLILERTDETNSVNVILPGLARISLNVAPIEERDNIMHNYQLPPNDAFAHLEMQFKFFNLSSTVEGVLGQTYRPNFINPVKRGVPMPVMGGEDRYATSSLYSADCKSCKYSNNKDAHSSSSSSEFILNPVGTFDAECSSRNGNGGIVCRR